MSTNRDYKAAEKERLALERGRTIPHYAGKLARTLSTRRKKGVFTPSKRAPK